MNCWIPDDVFESLKLRSGLPLCRLVYSDRDEYYVTSIVPVTVGIAFLLDLELSEYLIP